MKRVILHVDMDCFFASCEEREHPDYKNSPLIVGGSPSGRGVVATCNYAARKFGVHSGMPVSTAYMNCPHANFVRPDFALYKEVSQRVMSILRDNCVKLQKAGIDEAYLDISGMNVEETVGGIRRAIKKELGLTCSIGIASNKLLAKIASDYNKPDGVTYVKDGKFFLSNLNVRKLPGVGKKAEEKLKKLGINTIGDIVKNSRLIVERFGKYGQYYIRAANGNDDRELENNYEAKSMSRETTFQYDLQNEEALFPILEELAVRVHKQLLKEKMVCKTIGIKVRYQNFKTHTKETSLTVPTDSFETIISLQKKLMKEFLSHKRKIRLIGSKVSGLEEKESNQTILAGF